MEARIFRRHKCPARVVTPLIATASAFVLTVTPFATVPALASSAFRPDVRMQWWFDSWAIERQVWPVTRGRGVTVAVIDTGVNARLPDLRSAVLRGADFDGTGSDGRRDLSEETFGHGTAMAAYIAASGRGTGFYGIAPQAKIMPIVRRTGEEQLARAIRYAVDHGARIINISQGASPGPRACPPAVQAAVIHAARKDVIIVAAAGNTGDSSNNVEYPASCPGVVAVGAIDHQGRAWISTQRQSYVTLAAPGAVVAALDRQGRIRHGGSGTSAAAALASGAFALVRSRFPTMSARRVVQVVTNTTVDLGPPGYDNATGFGAISIRRSLRHSVSAHAANPVYQRLDNITRTAPSSPSPARAGSLPTPRPGAAATGPPVPTIVAGAAAVVLAGTAVLVVLGRARRYPLSRRRLR